MKYIFAIKVDCDEQDIYRALDVVMPFYQSHGDKTFGLQSSSIWFGGCRLHSDADGYKLNFNKQLQEDAVLMVKELLKIEKEINEKAGNPIYQLIRYIEGWDKDGNYCVLGPHEAEFYRLFVNN